MPHKVLIIEDETDINRLLAQILESDGYRTVQAFSGTEDEKCGYTKISAPFEEAGIPHVKMMKQLI